MLAKLAPKVGCSLKLEVSAGLFTKILTVDSA
jgi:hypothetical protein